MVATRVPVHLVVLALLVAVPSATSGDYVPPYPITQAPGAPEPPQSIWIGGASDEGPIVSWDASPTPDVDSYRVYWATVDGWAWMDVTDTTATLPSDIDPFISMITVTAFNGTQQSRASEFAIAPVAAHMPGAVPDYPYCDWLVVYVGPVGPNEPPVWIRYRLECLIPGP